MFDRWKTDFSNVRLQPRKFHFSHRAVTAGTTFGGRGAHVHRGSIGGAQERSLESLIEVTSNLGHALVAELPEEG
jgi:hypothetical protein